MPRLSRKAAAGLAVAVLALGGIIGAGGARFAIGPDSCDRSGAVSLR